MTWLGCLRMGLPIVLATALGCGPKSDDSGGGTGATGGGDDGGDDGGDGGDDGGDDGGGDDGGTAPAECASGVPCETEGDTCTEEGCCPCGYQCEGGVWTLYVCPDCVPPTCPEAAPADADACNECEHPTTEPCVYQDCDGVGRISATCDGQTWTTGVSPCGDGSDSGPCSTHDDCWPIGVCITTNSNCGDGFCQPLPGDCPDPRSCGCDFCDQGGTVCNGFTECTGCTLPP